MAELRSIALQIWQEHVDPFSSWDNSIRGYGAKIQRSAWEYATEMIGPRPKTQKEILWEHSKQRQGELQTRINLMLVFGGALLLWLLYYVLEGLGIIISAAVIWLAYSALRREDPAYPEVPEAAAHEDAVRQVSATLTQLAREQDRTVLGDDRPESLQRQVDGRWQPRARKPAAVPSVTWRGAEQLAAQWLQYLGADDVVVTKSSRDGGVDVRSPGVVVQVKHQASPVSPAVVQQIAGIAAIEDSVAIVFSTSGFSKQAQFVARQALVALFLCEVTTGGLRPQSDAASAILTNGIAHAGRSST